MSITTRQRAAVIVLSAVIAGGFVIHFTHSPEPKYQGNRLSVWLTEFDHWDGDTNAPVVLAMRAIGAQAVPNLVEICLANDSTLKQRAAVEFEKHPALLEHRFTTAPERWARAQLALRVMGGDARAALPAFLAALTNEDTFVRMRAVSALGWIGPEAEDCLPALIARQDDQVVRGNLIHALELIGRRPDLCVPVLMKALDDADPIVRQNAVHSLGAFRGQASAAVPALTKALTDRATARRAADALRKIQSDERVTNQSL